MLLQGPVLQVVLPALVEAGCAEGRDPGGSRAPGEDLLQVTAELRREITPLGGENQDDLVVALGGGPQSLGVAALVAAARHGAGREGDPLADHPPGQVDAQLLEGVVPVALPETVEGGAHHLLDLLRCWRAPGTGHGAKIRARERAPRPGGGEGPFQGPELDGFEPVQLPFHAGAQGSALRVR